MYGVTMIVSMAMFFLVISSQVAKGQLVEGTQRMQGPITPSLVCYLSVIESLNFEHNGKIL